MTQTRIPPAPARPFPALRALRRSGLALAAAMAVAAVPAELAAQDSPPPAPDRSMRLFEAPEAPRRTPAPAPAALQEAGFLGVAIEDLDAGEASDLGLSEPRGVRIRDVLDDGPAAEAGLREGDVLVEWDGESVRSVAQLGRLVRETPPGREVRISYLRDGDRDGATVTVGERPGPMARVRAMELSEEERREMREQLEDAREQMEEAREQWREEAEEARRRARVEFRRVHPHEEATVWTLARLRGPRIGIRLSSLTDQLADYFGLEDRSGALVVSVADDSPARDAGIQAGDVVLAVNGSTVESPGEAARLIREHTGREAEIELLRRGERLTVTASVPEDEGPAALELRLREMEPVIRGSLERIAPRLRRIEPLLRGALRQRGEVIL